MKKRKDYTTPLVSVMNVATGNILAASGITGKGEDIEWEIQSDNENDEHAARLYFSEDTDDGDDSWIK